MSKIKGGKQKRRNVNGGCKWWMVVNLDSLPPGDCYTQKCQVNSAKKLVFLETSGLAHFRGIVTLPGFALLFQYGRTDLF